MEEKEQLSCLEGRAEEDARLEREGAVFVEMSEPDLKLLKEAAMEFIALRGGGVTGVPLYVARRYAVDSNEAWERHVARVTARVERMQHILEVVLATGEEQ